MNNRKKHLLSAIVLAGFLVMALGSGDDKKSNNSGGASDQTSKPDVEILSQSANYESVTNSYTIHCRVKNNTPDLINYLDLQGTFYSKDGTIVGTGIGNAANLSANAEKTIDVIGLDIDNVDHYEVVVNNVMK